ncbi:MAG: PD40 domain-containing protein [Gammaproteobacteria bacterium]|nr:PD40 domain-containing protein [Gammaproteobacteria bacterium]
MTATRARRGRPAAATGWLLAMGLAGAAHGEESLLRVQQGTDISAVALGDGRLVLDLAGRLWTLPAEGGTATPLTPAGDYARRPAVSPDGHTLAYETLRDEGHQIMVMDTAGGDPRAVTAAPGHSLAPAWSPDGRRLAFASDRGGDFAIWELDLATNALRQLSFEAGDEIDPAWRPDGAALAYIHVHEGRSSLVLRPSAGSPRTVLTGERTLRAPAWRDDGLVIALVATDADGPRLRLAILSNPPVLKPAGGTENAVAARPAWLDHHRLLYAADGLLRPRETGAFAGTVIPFEATLVTHRAASPPARRLPAAAGVQPARGIAGFAVLPDGQLVASALGDLWQFDASGNLVRQLTLDVYADRDPAISPDGRSLAFTSDRDGTAQIWLMDLATRDTRRLTTEPDAAGHPAWNAAGDRVAFLAGGNGSASLRAANPASGETRTLAAGLVDPGSPAWSVDGAQVAVVQGLAGQPQLLLVPADGGGGGRRVTLPVAAAGPGPVSAQFAADGRALLVASAAGVRALPVLGNGLVGADWREIAPGPARLARWLPDGAVYVADADGMARVAPDGSIGRLPLAVDWQPASRGGRTIIRASRVFDGLGDDYLLDHEIVVEGSRIVTVRPWTGTDDGARIIDARGRTVVPGLIDLAITLTDRGGERLGRALLAFGVTTAQVIGGDDAAVREVAERWQARAAGPRLFASPAWCGAGSAPGPDIAGVPVGAVRLCPASGDRLPALVAPLQATDAAIWSPSWLATLSGQVHGVGPSPDGRGPRAAAGHGTGSYEQDAVEAMARAGVVFVPSLVTSGLPVLVHQQPDLLASRQYQALFRPEERLAHEQAWRPATTNPLGARTILRLRQRALGRLLASGGHLATASNAPAVPYGFGLQAEIRLLAGIGLSPAEVLRMATSGAARALGLQEDLGSLATGRMADLLVIDGDPLADPTHLLRIEAVMVDGMPRSLDDLLPAPDPMLGNFTKPVPAGSRKVGARSR